MWQFIYLFHKFYECKQATRSFVHAFFRKQPAHHLQFIENINHFETDTRKTSHALLMLSPGAWLVASAQYPRIKYFNYDGLTYEFVRALNLNGYLVDIAILNKEFTPGKRYDLFIGHGGHCKTTIDSLEDGVPVFQYVSGAHWRAFNEESDQRYSRYAANRNIPKPSSFRRDLTPFLEGEDYLANKADVLLTINCPRMVDTFGELKEKFFFTGLGAYPDKAIAVEATQRDFSAGTKGFIYVGGSGGNIQKGLDLLLEAFARKPELHLYIYCRVEPEILTTHRKELSLPNIHYIYHLRTPIFQYYLRRILRRVNYTIHAPINTGMGTAFMGSMAHGYIPVGYVDLPPHGDCSVTTDDWSVESIVECISRAAGMTADWCRQAHDEVIGLYEEICGISHLRKKLEAAFSAEHLEEIRSRKKQAPHTACRPPNPQTHIQ